nr:MAG TPA: AAA domain protein [Caudoviricetes sp.]
MARAYSNANIRSARFRVADFGGAWRDSIGMPVLRGTWLIYGGSGSGKTSFCLQLAKYLSQYGRVLYNSLEQGLSPTMQSAWIASGMEEAGRRVKLLDREGYDELFERLAKRQSPEIVIIDSINYLRGLRLSDYQLLSQRYRKKLFVIVAHEKGGEPKGALAQAIRYDADVKIRVEGYRAMVTSRYATSEVGGQDYIIWDKGAEGYWGTATTDPETRDQRKKRQKQLQTDDSNEG